MTSIRSDCIPREDINIESRVEQELYVANEQNVNIPIMTSPTMKPTKGKCKYCGKRFSLSTVLEEHIQNYHIPMTKYLNPSRQKETCKKNIIEN